MTGMLDPNLPPPHTNNVWYSQSSSDTVFVLVHGIFSDSRSCWLYANQSTPTRNLYWPELIRDDNSFANASIFLGGYYTSVDAGNYDILQASKELRDGLQRQEVLKRQNVIFIAHSAGGVVTRHMIYHNQSLFRNKHVGIVLYASPSTGAHLADTLSFLSEWFNQRLGAQLQTDSVFLKDLDSNFRDLIDRSRSDPDALHITGAECIENHFIIHRKFLPDKVTVVSETSGSHYFGSPTYLRNTDHFSIVKPDGLAHPTHQFLAAYYEKFKRDTYNNSKPVDRLGPKVDYDLVANVTGSIEEPTPNQKVCKTFRCSGVVAGLQEGLSLWLAVEKGVRIWPKESRPVPGTDNKWTVYLFEDGGSDNFSVALFIADQRASKRIQAWLDEGARTGNYVEMKNLQGARRIVRIDGLSIIP
jgi:hypothetical protein